MLNKILISFVILLLFSATHAGELELNPKHPDKYTVVRGDTLWGISAKFLTEPWRWQEIWQINPQIKNPHLIYPGDTVSLSYEDGQPILNLERAGSVVSGRNVKLSPTIRSSENIQAIPAIPLDAIQQFLKWPLILEDDQMEDWPYVVSSYDGHLMASVNNKIYIRGIPENLGAKQYSIYRRGPAYVNIKEDKNDDDEVLGYEAIYVGQARIERGGDPASAIITSVKREVMIGDRLIPNSEKDNFTTEFIPSSTPNNVEGNILSVLDGVSQIGQYQIVILNLGEESGIEPGNVLGIFQSNVTVEDTIGPNKRKTKEEEDNDRIIFENEDTNFFNRELSKLFNAIRNTVKNIDENYPGFANKKTKSEAINLPDENVGVLMVFRTFEKISYALVMEISGPVHVADVVRNL